MKSTEIEHVPRQTFFWILGTLITIETLVIGALITSFDRQITGTNARLTEVQTVLTARIDRNEEAIGTVETDIRAILVGIEQVKARLGIVEIGRQ